MDRFMEETEYPLGVTNAEFAYRTWTSVVGKGQLVFKESFIPISNNDKASPDFAKSPMTPNHQNAGVQNKWFYILSHGENGTNDNSDQYSVQGIGEDEAAIITYLNLIVNMHHYSNYEDARRGAIAIADQRYGNDPCAFERVQVQNAWYAVGLGEESSCPVSNEPRVREVVVAPKVYPNPSDGQFEIVWDKVGMRSIQITDIVGKVLWDREPKIAKSYIVDLRDFSDGIYFATFSGKNLACTVKLLKQ